MKKICDMVKKAKIISISCDEVATISSKLMVLIHTHDVAYWQRLPLILVLKMLMEGAISKDLHTIILHGLKGYGGLVDEENASKCICFRADGVQIVCIGVTTPWKGPMVTGVHYTNHWTHFIFQTLSGLPIVVNAEEMLQILYNLLST